MLLALAGLLFVPSPATPQASSPGWKAGVARADITPGKPLWMAGYGSRDRPSEGTLHPLWVKALALEDSTGRRAVLITSDLLGFPKPVSDAIRDRLWRQFGLRREEVMLTSSHTHSAPILRRSLSDVYPLDDAAWADIDEYTQEVEDRVVQLVGEALDRLSPAQLSSSAGVVRFAVNRRNNTESGILATSDLKGPVDHSVPVLKVEDAEGRLLAVAFGYACHATTLSGYDWSGDWPGFAQIALEEAHPGVTALFFAGAGADQNPLPRRSIPLARQYGRELAVAVDRVLEEPMQPLASSLATKYAEVDLTLAAPPAREELQKLAASEDAGWRSRWAARILNEMDQGTFAPHDYPYPVQLWQFGSQTMVALGGEVVVDYAIQLKRLLGQDLFVAAYANDVMGYIPSLRVLNEGGYEGASSQQAYGFSSPWTPDIESRIIGEILRLAAQMNLPLQETTFE